MNVRPESEKDGPEPEISPVPTGPQIENQIQRQREKRIVKSHGRSVITSVSDRNARPTRPAVE